jgi:hypothetical protein
LTHLSVVTTLEEQKANPPSPPSNPNWGAKTTANLAGSQKQKKAKRNRRLQDLNLRGQSPTDNVESYEFKSVPLTTPAKRLREAEALLYIDIAKSQLVLFALGA